MSRDITTVPPAGIEPATRGLVTMERPALPHLAWVIHHDGADGATYGKEPAVASLSRSAGPIHLGLDVHKDSISVAILDPHSEAPEVERIFNDEASVRRLIARF